MGVVTQFFYVGAQVCVSSFFIRFAERVAGIEEKTAALYLSGALLGFTAGRFIGTALMQYVRPARLLALYSLINFFLVLLAVLLPGKPSVYALMGVEFFMSIMFPTIFSLSIRGLGAKTKEGSSLVIMAIVGGAIFPVIAGRVSDASSIQVAYVVPALCFLVVLFFALNRKIRRNYRRWQWHWPSHCAAFCPPRGGGPHHRAQRRSRSASSRRNPAGWGHGPRARRRREPASAGSSGV
jgi:FHS family L-fucose permease-like MFS transporter